VSTITKPITVAEYDRMIEDGTIGEDDPVELIEGVVVPKMPRNPPHRVSTRKTAKALERMVPPGWYVQVQEAIVIEPENKPEPDVAVVPAELEYDATRDPLAAECCLVVEVADSSLEYDRTKKLALYAAAGIPVYWIVNLIDRVVEVYSTPVGGAYAAPTVLGEGELVEVEVAGQVLGTIAVADLLPRAEGGAP
jgi:Uma2 family endonuclease